MTYPKLKIDKYINGRYSALESVAGALRVLGWITIIFTVIMAIALFGILADLFPIAKTIAVSLDGVGVSNPSLRGTSSQAGSPLPFIGGGIFAIVGIFMGLIQIAFGELLFLLVDLSDETSVATREQLRFYRWYAKKERAKNE